jgi:hypothetical protein
MNAPNETSLARPAALPDEWVARIFSVMSALYGSQFADLWAGTNQDEVRGMWARKLAGFASMPGAIKAALDSLDSRAKPPNLPEFLGLCREEARRNQPAPTRPALEYTATPEEIAEAANRIAKATSVSATGRDPRDWAKRPVSQFAMTAVIDLAERQKDAEFAAILSGHRENGVVGPDGTLLKRWNSMAEQWVMI